MWLFRATMNLTMHGKVFGPGGKINCGYYSCNFISTATGAAVFAPYKMITYGDTRVAYVGVSTPESFTKSTPAYFQDGAGNYIYSFCEVKADRVCTAKSRQVWTLPGMKAPIM